MYGQTLSATELPPKPGRSFFYTNPSAAQLPWSVIRGDSAQAALLGYSPGSDMPPLGLYRLYDKLWIVMRPMSASLLEVFPAYSSLAVRGSGFLSWLSFSLALWVGGLYIRSCSKPQTM